MSSDIGKLTPVECYLEGACCCGRAAHPAEPDKACGNMHSAAHGSTRMSAHTCIDMATRAAQLHYIEPTIMCTEVVVGVRVVVRVQMRAGMRTDMCVEVCGGRASVCKSMRMSACVSALCVLWHTYIVMALYSHDLHHALFGIPINLCPNIAMTCTMCSLVSLYSYGLI